MFNLLTSMRFLLLHFLVWLMLGCSVLWEVLAYEPFSTGIENTCEANEAYAVS